uniref:Candidate secreted effector n=1 Tax=Meloidogyne incognita TaxID=6306 RepID=A0A914LBF8_MELIC
MNCYINNLSIYLRKRISSNSSNCTTCYHSKHSTGWTCHGAKTSAILSTKISSSTSANTCTYSSTKTKTTCFTISRSI